MMGEVCLTDQNWPRQNVHDKKISRIAVYIEQETSMLQEIVREHMIIKAESVWWYLLIKENCCPHRLQVENVEAYGKKHQMHGER